MSGLEKIRNLTTEALRSFVACSQNKREVLRKVGVCVSDPRIRSLLTERCELEGISTKHFGGHGMRTDIKTVRLAVLESVSISEALRKLSLVDRGAANKWLKGVCKRHEIDTSHFTGASINKRAWGEGSMYTEGSLYSKGCLAKLFAETQDFGTVRP